MERRVQLVELFVGDAGDFGGQLQVDLAGVSTRAK